MAVPTLSACAPNLIFTGGQLVTLTGTNFRLPYPLPSDVNGPYPTPPPTVAVTVNGTPTVDVRVLSDTQLTCIVGANDEASAASVTIALQNLDVNGNPIGGELVSATGLLDFSRPDLTLEADFTRATRALLKLIKQQVIPNVIMTVETDYSSTPGVTVFDVPEIASLPAVVLSGPKSKWNPIYEYDKTPEQAVGSTGFNRRRMIRTVDLTWQVTVYDDHELRILNLFALMEQFVVSNVWLYVQRDPSDSSLGTVRYELEEAEEWQITTAPNTSNVKSFSGQLLIRGFQYEDIIGFPNQMVRETGQTADTITTEETSFSD